MALKNLDNRFDKFLEEYLENIKRELPESFRAKQLSGDKIERTLVFEFETRFLKQPFLNIMKEISPKFWRYQKLYSRGNNYRQDGKKLQKCLL